MKHTANSLARLVLLSLLLLAGQCPAETVSDIANTKHNFSTTGPGPVRATTQTEICVFCHTPHGASNFPGSPLWNRQLSDPSNVRVIQKGPWHPGERLQTVAFEQGAIQVDYAPWLGRGQTSSQIWLRDGSATRVAARIGDTVPLKTGNYRFYTTSNKGYAAVLSWRDDAGRVQAGAIHFPSYPLFDWNQLSQWTTPAGTSLELALIPPDPVAEDQSWTLDSRQAKGSLVVKGLDQTATLITGDSLRLPGGQLRFEAVRMWMGYEIFYDPTLVWLFAAALVGIFGLGWHSLLSSAYRS